MPFQPLTSYLSKYGGNNDRHLESFLIIKENFISKKVLYPGSWIHVTPSLAFSYVVYVDLFAKMKSAFTNSDIIAYIEKNKMYEDKPRIVFHKADYRKDVREEKKSFDLLISLSSGFVSQACASYLKEGGLLLANNDHYDAIMAFTDSRFKLIGVFKTPKLLIKSENEIQKYFLTKKGEHITREMVDENSKRAPSKAKHKLKLKAPLYLFQHLK